MFYTARFDFRPNEAQRAARGGDYLPLREGDAVRVDSTIDADWVEGSRVNDPREHGQMPIGYLDRVWEPSEIERLKEAWIMASRALKSAEAEGEEVRRPARLASRRAAL